MKQIVLATLLSFSLSSAAYSSPSDSNTSIKQGSKKISSESDYERKARAALKKITTEQIEKIKEVANNTGSANEKNLKGFVLSTQISSFSDIPKNIDLEVESLKKQTQFLIRKIALDIEINRKSYRGVLTLDDNGQITYKSNTNLPKDLDRKRKDLLESNLKNSVSIRSASLALKLLAGINKDIIEKAKQAKDRKLKEKLYMQQAIYVYEISDIVLSLLDSISLDGKDTILKLHKQAEERVNNSISSLEKQKDEAKQLNREGLMSKKGLEKELSGLDLMEKANERSLETWKGVLKQIGNQQKFLDNLKSKRKLIAYKQSKAKLQIETLRDLRGVATLRDSIGSIDDIIDTVDQLDLLVLDEKAVTELLGGYEN